MALLLVSQPSFFIILLNVCIYFNFDKREKAGDVFENYLHTVNKRYFYKTKTQAFLPDYSLKRGVMFLTLAIRDLLFPNK